LPLYQTVFHDSVVTTHHWGYASLKFRDQMDTVELLELLYNVPPLYHINQEEFKKHGKRIKAHYDFFSPLHKETALLPVTDFLWLTPDHLVQSSKFGDKIIMVANFGNEDYKYEDILVSGGSIMAKWIDSGKKTVFKNH